MDILESDITVVILITDPYKPNNFWKNVPLKAFKKCSRTQL
jgi:hypothetical protein